MGGVRILQVAFLFLCKVRRFFVDVDDNVLGFRVVLDFQHLIFEISFLMFTGSVCLYAPIYFALWDGSIT